MAPASADIDLLASQLPNPLTPMAFLPPDLAFQLTVASYVLVGALVGQIWDILNTLSVDYKMFTRFRIGLPGIVYVISRFSTLAYLLYSTIYESDCAIGNCTKLSKICPWLFTIAHPSTSLLFFFRIRAMYHDNKFIIVFFFLMWLAVVGGSATAIFGVSGLNIGTTKYCINGKLEPYVSAGAIVPMVYDSFVFVAISWRLMQLSTTEDPTLKEGAKVMIFGHNLSAFPKAMLQDGQAYYLSTLGMACMTVIIFYIKSIPLVYRSILGIPNLTLINVMACRVFRKTKFGAYRESMGITGQTGGITGPIAFANPPSHATCTTGTTMDEASGQFEIELGKFSRNHELPREDSASTSKPGEHEKIPSMV
ncbi:hypothetical protein BDZ97DRAFT_1998710 [Flammula alnicola]|nr:hypothetical protein BDZ97DRAFT_1998710 [Flammula alnicola]